jgi:hypothetical protein
MLNLIVLTVLCLLKIEKRIFFEGLETLFLKKFHEQVIKVFVLNFPEKDPLFTGKSVLPDSLPKTAAASHEKPLVFNWDDVWKHTELLTR